MKTDKSSFHFEGATLTSCSVNAKYIRSSVAYSGVTCDGDSLTVWADHELSQGVANSFKSGLSNSNQMVMDDSASSPGELYFFVDVTVTMVVRDVTLTATLRVGQGRHFGVYRNWWVGSTACRRKDKTLECDTTTAGTTLFLTQEDGDIATTSARFA
jgi:hypothetical protein